MIRMDDQQSETEPAFTEFTKDPAVETGRAASKYDATAGSEAPSNSQKLTDDADAFCADLERIFRRAYGEVPKAAELGELRAQQATFRSLMHRAVSQGVDSNQKLSVLSIERDQLKDAVVRGRADFLNYQSRSTKELERAEELSLRRYVSELLPILDSLDLGLRDASGAQADVERLKQALDMISTSLRQVLSVRGLERIAAAGKPFDPVIHEAVAKLPADPEKSEKTMMVLEELRPGYLWKGLVLRPAQVLVSEIKKP